MPSQHHLAEHEPQRLRKYLCMVLYDIQSYLHPSWHRALALPPRASSRVVNQLLHIWLNDHLIDTHDAATHCPPVRLTGDLLHDLINQGTHSAPLLRCLSEWPRLEPIVYLLGAHASHASLAAAGRLPFLRWQAGAFISVPAARPGFTTWDANARQMAARGVPHGLSSPLNTEALSPEKSANDGALDLTIYRLGASIISTALGSAQPLLIKYLSLLLPHTTDVRRLCSLPVWRGHAAQAAFLIDLASAFQRASERTSHRSERNNDV